MSLAKQNFATASEEAINQQINTELQASQVYLSMSAWAQHTSVALPGERIHAHTTGRRPRSKSDRLAVRFGKVFPRTSPRGLETASPLFAYILLISIHELRNVNMRNTWLVSDLGHREIACTRVKLNRYARIQQTTWTLVVARSSFAPFRHPRQVSAYHTAIYTTDVCWPVSSFSALDWLEICKERHRVGAPAGKGYV